MTRQEFIQEAALRLISARPNTPMGDIADLANALAVYIYKDEPEAPSEPAKPAPPVSASSDFKSDSLEDLLREVDRIEAADVEERKKSGMYCQMAGFAVRLANVLRREKVETVGELMALGSRGMIRKQDVGPGCISLLKRAFENLYNIKNW